MKDEIKKTIASRSEGFIKPNVNKILYHDQLLLPTAKNLGLDKNKTANLDTLNLERAIYNKVFEQNWTWLNEDQRIQFLKDTKWGLTKGTILDLASVTGAGILASLYAAVKITGFSFYTGMSTAIFSLASTLGFTVPFPLYMGASTAISVATSSIGWAIAAILAGTQMYKWITEKKVTNEAEILKTVLHFHHYKVSSMQEAGIKLTLGNP